MGSIAEFNNTLPYTLADNFSTGSYTDTVGLYGTGPDYFGGFIGITTQKPTDRAENNYYANSNNTCTGIASPQKPTCNLVANANVFNDISHGVYTRADNTWDFNNTWKAVSGGLPELR